LYRANVGNILGKYHQSNLDYEAVLRHDHNNVEVLLRNAECLNKMGQFSSSLNKLAQALHSDTGHFRHEILCKRIEIWLNPSSFNLKEAKKDLEKLANQGGEPGELNLMRGLVLHAEGLHKQSSLSFEECLKCGSSKPTMMRALIELTKTCIENRDFYSAFYQVSRSRYYELVGDEL
jgi:tetratricopeptide (TPR) repeat protein